MNLIKYITPLLFMIGLAGCTSVQEQNSLAEYRANLIAADLPIQYGPLNVVGAKSHDNVVEITMIYSSTTATVPAGELVDKGLASFCTMPEVNELLHKGVIYHIILRGDRGQLLTDKYATSEACNSNLRNLH